MASRDLTTPYVRMRSAMHRKRPDDNSGTSGALLSATSAAHVDVSALDGVPPVYVDLVNDVSGDINTIGVKISDLQRAHELRLQVEFDPQAEAIKEREIEIMTAEIARVFNIAGMKLKRIANHSADAKATEIKIRANIQRGLATRLHDQSSQFRSQQKEYLARIQKLRAGTSIASLIGTGGREGRDEGFTDEQMSELATAEEYVDERVREIHRIAKSVEELATLFKELATLIVYQGTILDRIDHNMEQAVSHARDGTAHLVKAEESQKSARPIWCMIVLMVLIVIFVVIIVVNAGK